MLEMSQSCLSLSFSKTVLPFISLTHPVRLMDLPFSAALASFFSALSTFLSPLLPGLLAGSCASMLSEAVMTNANNNVSKRFIGSPRVGNAFYPLEMQPPRRRRAAITIKTNHLHNTRGKKMLRSGLHFFREFLLELLHLASHHKLAVGLVAFIDKIFLVIIFCHKKFPRRLQCRDDRIRP